MKKRRKRQVSGSHGEDLMLMFAFWRQLFPPREKKNPSRKKGTEGTMSLDLPIRPPPSPPSPSTSSPNAVPPPEEERPSPIHLVLNTPELLEQILLSLRLKRRSALKAVLRCTRVNRFFYATISSSPALQTALFLTPPRPPPAVDLPLHLHLYGSIPHPPPPRRNPIIPCTTDDDFPFDTHSGQGGMAVRASNFRFTIILSRRQIRKVVPVPVHEDGVDEVGAGTRGVDLYVYIEKLSGPEKGKQRRSWAEISNQTGEGPGGDEMGKREGEEESWRRMYLSNRRLVIRSITAAGYIYGSARLWERRSRGGQEMVLVDPRVGDVVDVVLGRKGWGRWRVNESAGRFAVRERTRGKKGENGGVDDGEGCYSG